MVEGATQVMDDISDHQGKLHTDGCHGTEVIHAVATIRRILETNGKRIFFDENVPRLFQFDGVLFGPL
jgi:hypothetical protein